MTDYADWQEPQAHATAIAATGVPLLGLASQLVTTATKVIGPSTTQFFTTANVTQVGYHGTFEVQFPSAATVPFCRARLSWLDNLTGYSLGTDDYILPGAQAASLFTTTAAGLARGNRVQLAIDNLDPAQSATVTCTLNEDSIPRNGDSWYYPNLLNAAVTVPGFTLPGLPDDESVLGVLDNVTIAASSSNTYLLGMHAGLVNIGYELSAGTAANLSIRMRPAPDSVYSGHNIIYSATSSPSNFQVAFPRAPVRLIVANAATTAMTLSLSAIRADQP